MRVEKVEIDFAGNCNECTTTETMTLRNSFVSQVHIGDRLSQSTLIRLCRKHALELANLLKRNSL
jgi:hypothetical protein